MKLNNIRLLTENFDKMFLFYRDTLGFEVTWGNLGEVYASFNCHETTGIALFARDIMSHVTKTSDLPIHSPAQDKVALIFEVQNVDDLFNRYLQNGLQFTTTPHDQKDWGIRVAHLRDPDGNLIEFYSNIEKSEWSEGLKEKAEKYS